MNQIKFYEKKLRYEIDSSDLFEALNNGTHTIVIDTRAKELYDIEHIPTSINIPHRAMSEETTDKSKMYITYCDGIGCNASTKGAINLVNLGFNVKELLGGLDWWRRDGYSTKGTKGTNRINIVCGC